MLRRRRLFDVVDASDKISRFIASILHRKFDKSVVFARSVIERRRQRRLLQRLRKHERFAHAGSFKIVQEAQSDMSHDIQ
jgi:hypothetical protein